MLRIMWPGPNAAADALLVRYLDRSLPGWRLRTLVEIEGAEVLDRLWPFTDRTIVGERVQPLAEELLDARLVAIAVGAPMAFDDMERAARIALQARLVVAMTAATHAMLTPGPVIRLPRGLTDAQTTTALALRVLYQAPLSTEGL